MTVQSRSWTCILTYFFCEGVIWVILNGLMMMSTDVYDALGTAMGVIDKIKGSLGYTRRKLSQTCVNFTYDGAYATVEQRVAGGGTLSLIDNVTRVLGVPEKSITGVWDFAHNMQIVWMNGISNNPVFLDVITTLFDAMKQFRVGKENAVFNEAAIELHNYVLRNKKEQSTRFVSSLAKGLKTAMQNWPTIVNILSEDLQEKASMSRNTEAKVIEAQLKKLRSPKTLLLAVGLCQVLDYYCPASIEVR